MVGRKAVDCGDLNMRQFKSIEDTAEDIWANALD
jgi:hypothetical protein